MITSSSNKQLRYIQGLMKKSKMRREEGLYVAEGIRMCSEIPQKDIHSLFLSESFEKSGKASEFFNQVDKIEIVSDDVFKSLSDTKTPQGILAVVKQKQYRLGELIEKYGFYMVLESIQDPGNLGTIIRAAEGAGANGIIMNDTTADIYNPKVIRSTMGSILRVPFLYTDDLSSTINELKKNEITIYAAHLEGEANYEDFNYKKGCGFLIGNEGNGLTDEMASKSDHWIKIPMLGGVESLNAAVASSVLMFEVARQRRT